MLNSTIGSGSTTPGGFGPAVTAPGFPGISTNPMYVRLPLCISDSGHRFAIGMYHKDRAVCERCGLIRKQEDAS